MELLIRNSSFLSRTFHGFLLIGMIVSMIACGVEVESSGGSGEFPSDPNEEPEWLIPEDEIISAQGKDGIPSIDDPQFETIENIDFIPDERLILGIRIGEEVRGYPLQIMDWHEIVNDEFSEENVAITYCPLTGTGIAWDRGQSEYGVSGLLFRNNLIAYDRSTESRWSQMQLRSVYGWRIGNDVTLIDIVEMRWGAWKKAFPGSKVMTTETGYDRDYGGYAYGNSFTEEGSAQLYPVKNRDTRLSKMEKVHGVIASWTADPEATVRTYPIDYFSSGIQVVNDTLQGESIVLAGSSSNEFAVSFSSEIKDELLTFEAIQDSLPIIMIDNEGTHWDLFGRAVSGPREGEQLKPTKSYTGYWFAWADFFPDLQLYEFE